MTYVSIRPYGRRESAPGNELTIAEALTLRRVLQVERAVRFKGESCLAVVYVSLFSAMQSCATNKTKSSSTKE